MRGVNRRVVVPAAFAVVLLGYALGQAPSDGESAPTASPSSPTSVAESSAPVVAAKAASSAASPAAPASSPSAPTSATSTSHVPAATSTSAAVERLTVTRVVDGDTLKASDGSTVRLVGIDTPERGQCGYDAATRNLEVLTAGKTINLIAGGGDDRDRYGRVLRYVEAGGVDVNLAQIKAGLANARYDSRDGYGRHAREAAYRAADAATMHKCAATPKPAPAKISTPRPAPAKTHTKPRPAPVAPKHPAKSEAVRYGSCAEARAAGAAPIHRGEPGYSSKLDRDGDGIACE